MIWTGCDNVAFVPDSDLSSSTNPQPLWSRDLRKLLNSSPDNVHYVFFSTAGDAKEKVEALEADYNDILAGWTEEKQAQWAGRLHYVKRPFYETDGWPADHFSLTGYGFVVDRNLYDEVELTVALHYVFNTPEDPVIFDVSHQVYPHKILTGRRHRMHTLRKSGPTCFLDLTIGYYPQITFPFELRETIRWMLPLYGVDVSSSATQEEKSDDEHIDEDANDFSAAKPPVVTFIQRRSRCAAADRAWIERMKNTSIESNVTDEAIDRAARGSARRRRRASGARRRPGSRACRARRRPRRASRGPRASWARRGWT